MSKLKLLAIIAIDFIPSRVTSEIKGIAVPYMSHCTVVSSVYSIQKLAYRTVTFQ